MTLRATIRQEWGPLNSDSPHHAMRILLMVGAKRCCDVALHGEHVQMIALGGSTCVP